MRKPITMDPDERDYYSLNVPLGQVYVTKEARAALDAVGIGVPLALEISPLLREPQDERSRESMRQMSLTASLTEPRRRSPGRRLVSRLGHHSVDQGKKPLLLR